MLEDLPRKQVLQNLELYKQFVRESSNIEVEHGPFHDIVLYYSALFTTDNQQQIATALSSLNLKQLLQDAESLPAVHIDNLAANWLITRQQGGKATGVITLWLSRPVITSIHKGTELKLGNVYLRVNDTYVLRTPEGGSLLLNDRVLRPQGTMYVATIPVQAKEIGERGNLRKGLEIQLLNPPVTIKKVITASDFTGGSEPETNTQVVKRLIAARTGLMIS